MKATVLTKHVEFDLSSKYGDIVITADIGGQ